jgi:hypothetical protein
MPVQTIFSSGTGAQSELEVPAFLTIVFSIIAGWLLVSVWQRVLENFAYGTLGMNSRSTVHALIVAIVASTAFFAFIWMIDEYEIVPVATGAGALGGATEGLVEGGSGSSNAILGQLSKTRNGHPVVLGQPLNNLF